MKAALSSLLLVLATGCAHVQPMPLPTSEPAALPSTEAAAPRAAVQRGGGVFLAGRSTSLTADTRAFRPGDVLTVLLAETTQASKSAGTQIGKAAGGSLGVSIRDRSLAADLGVQRDFNGNASSSQQNTLQGAITVVVQDVMPNGLLKVVGEKSLWINQGEELIRLGGYVRAADVDADNRVSSQRIANARISYSGQGDMASANTPGWLTRLFNSPLMPF